MNQPFLVHVYSKVEGAELVEAPFKEKEKAIKFAKFVFKHPQIYKVKVWDLRISEPVLNVETHPALVLHLV